MNQTQKFLNLSMSLMIAGSLLSACGPAANQANTSNPGTVASNNPGTVASNNPGTVASSNPGTPASSNPTTPASSNPGSTAAASSSASSRADLAAEMQAVAADDAALSDSQNADAGFSTQAIGIVGGGEINATAMLGTGAMTPVAATARNRVRINAATQTKVQAQVKARADMAKARKAALQASGAVKVNDDGTLTVDPAKLKASVKANLEKRKAAFQTRIGNLKAGLAVKKALVKDRLDKLRRRNNVTRTSDIVETTNADGSTTKSLTVEFKNEKTGVMRTVVGSRTFLNNKLVSGDYELKVTGPNGYERTVNRSVVINADGSRTINTEAMTKWASGKTRERSEERTVGADGTASGSGTVTVTVNGQTKVYDYSVSVDANQNETVNGDDAPNTADEAAETVEVTVVDEAATTADTVIVEVAPSAGAAAETTEETVDESVDADVVAEASASTDVNAEAAAV